MDIGKRLNECLNDVGMKQKDLAAKLGIAPSTLNGYFKNIREPDAETFVKLAMELNTSVDYLLGKIDTKKDPIQTDEANAELFNTLNRLSVEKIEVIAKLAELLDNQNHEQP